MDDGIFVAVSLGNGVDVCVIGSLNLVAVCVTGGTKGEDVGETVTVTGAGSIGLQREIVAMTPVNTNTNKMSEMATAT